MRVKGEGSIETLKSGKFRGVITLEGKRFFGPTVENKRDALPAMWRKLDRMSQAEESESGLPFLTYVERHLKRMSFSSHSPTTIDLWKAFKTKIVNDEIANAPLDLMSDQLIEAWLSRQSGQARTKNNYLALVKQVLRENNITCKVKPIKSRKGKQVKRILSPDDSDELLSLPMRDEVRTMILLAMKMGLTVPRWPG